MSRLLAFFLMITFTTALCAEEIKAPPFDQRAIAPSKLLQKFKNTSFENIESTQRGSGTNIYRNTMPSVVKIVTEDGEGTGVVISDIMNGVILTNFHVIENFQTVGVIFSTDQENDKLSLGSVIKIDEIRDLALVSLNSQRDDIIPLSISQIPGDIGADVHAIGHPLGEDWTYTRGYISQLRRNYSWQTDLNTHHSADVIQTQTPINPGNSGGPLVNDAGELIGINSFRNEDAQGINFAVSITSVSDFLMSEGDVVSKSMPENSSIFGKMVRSFDENSNGYADLYLFDKSYNKTADRIVFDDDEDLVADRIHIDDDENGIVEVTIDFVIYEGQEIAYYEFDDDQDGTFELIGVDFDLDGKIDDIGPKD